MAEPMTAHQVVEGNHSEANDKDALAQIAHGMAHNVQQCCIVCNCSFYRNSLRYFS